MFLRLFLFAAFLPTLLMSCKDKVNTTETPVKVSVVEIEKSVGKTTMTLSGELTAASRHELSFLVAGKITKIKVKEGDQIKKGTVLATLDASDYNQALAIAKSKLDEANDQYTRLSSMYASGSLPEADFNKIKSLREEAKANYAIYANKLKYTTITAPLDGVISHVWVKNGMNVTEGAPIITLINTEQIYAKVGIAENAIASVSVSDSCLVIIPAVQDTLKSNIFKLSPSASRLTRTYEANIPISNLDNRYKDGMLCTVLITKTDDKESIALPMQLISKDISGYNYVFVARNKVAKKQRVILGDLQGNLITIVKGLSKGDKVIVNPPLNLYDGSALIL